jgi:hypothetical protein
MKKKTKTIVFVKFQTSPGYSQTWNKESQKKYPIFILWKIIFRTLYTTFVRPHAVSAWSPYIRRDIASLEVSREGQRDWLNSLRALTRRFTQKSFGFVFQIRVLGLGINIFRFWVWILG